MTEPTREEVWEWLKASPVYASGAVDQILAALRHFAPGAVEMEIAFMGTDDMRVVVSEIVLPCSNDYLESICDRVAMEFHRLATTPKRAKVDRFDITESDVGRYVRRISSKDVGRIVRDGGNGWLHPTLKYEWKGDRGDFEYVTVAVAEGRERGDG